MWLVGGGMLTWGASEDAVTSPRANVSVPPSAGSPIEGRDVAVQAGVKRKLRKSFSGWFGVAVWSFAVLRM
jgi:hypothetical protein